MSPHPHPLTPPHPRPPQDLRPHGVKVVLIEPAHVATDMAKAQGGTRYSEVKPELMIQVGGWCWWVRRPAAHTAPSPPPTPSLQWGCPPPPPPLPPTPCSPKTWQAEAALLAFRMSAAAAPAEIVLNRLHTPYVA